MIQLSKGHYGWEFRVISDKTLKSVALNATYYKTKEEALEAIGHLAQLIDGCTLVNNPQAVEVWHDDKILEAAKN